MDGFVKSIKGGIGTCCVPLFRFYIRYFPFQFGKRFLLGKVIWREYRYVARTKAGFKMAGRSADQVQGFIYYFGVWEPNLSAFIESRLSLGRTFIDIGANVGYFTLLAARKGSVVSIEAFPSIFSTLTENVLRNRLNNVRLVPYAVIDTARDIQMFHGGESNEGRSTTVAGRFQSQAITVRGKPLDALLTDNEIASARMIKIDVEGAERAVIVGMKSLLPKFPDDIEIVVEVSPSAPGQANEIFAIFESAGFFPYLIENSYELGYYLSSPAPTRPLRMRELPIKMTDVVFSKINADAL